MSGNKALRRALETTDAHRIGTDLPLIVDTTELITPQVAQEMLQQNKHNRPINWHKVEEYASIMRRGEWKLHPQGIILDADGNLLTGQKRLWAIVYSGRAVYMRVSRGTPPGVEKVIDRGVPQSARDLASRDTGRRHSPVEASIARGSLALCGILRPSTDVLAEEIERGADLVSLMLRLTAGTQKSKAVLMLLSAMSIEVPKENLELFAKRLPTLALRMVSTLHPMTAEKCWGRGAAFSFAMERAREIVKAAR